MYCVYAVHEILKPHHPIMSGINLLNEYIALATNGFERNKIGFTQSEVLFDYVGDYNQAIISFLRVLYLISKFSPI
jgi:hypothetical protein